MDRVWPGVTLLLILHLLSISDVPTTYFEADLQPNQVALFSFRSIPQGIGLGCTRMIRGYMHNIGSLFRVCGSVPIRHSS